MTTLTTNAAPVGEFRGIYTEPTIEPRGINVNPRDISSLKRFEQLGIIGLGGLDDKDV